MKKINYPIEHPETHEWRYKGQWYDNYPREEVEQDEAARDEWCDRELHRRREEE